MSEANDRMPDVCWGCFEEHGPGYGEIYDPTSWRYETPAWVVASYGCVNGHEWECGWAAEVAEGKVAI